VTPLSEPTVSLKLFRSKVAPLPLIETFEVSMIRLAALRRRVPALMFVVPV
jgi:hypothetical protein